MDWYFVGKWDNCCPFMLVDSKGETLFSLDDTGEIDYLHEGNWIPGKIVDGFLLSYKFISNDGAMEFTVETTHVFRAKQTKETIEYLRNKRRR